MWASLCNFLYGKFFYKPEVKAPPSSNDSAIDPVYGKRLKLSHPDFDTSDLVNQTQTSQRFAMQAKKYLTDSDDDDECRVIAEIPRKVTAEPSSTAVRAHVSVIKRRIPTADDLSSPSSFQGEASQMNNDESNDTTVLRFKTSSERNHPTSNRSRKFFNTQRASHSKAARTRVIYKHHSKRNSSSPDESYRLSEKYHYIKLIQAHASLDLLEVAPLTISTQKRRPGSPIPIIDLTEDTSSEDEMISKPNSPVMTRAPTPEEDSDVQFIEEVPRVRSFQDVIRITPVDTNEAIQQMSTNDSDNTPEVPNSVDVRQHAVISLDEEDDDEDEEEEPPFGQMLEERLRKYMHITDPPREEVETTSEEEQPLPDLTPEQENKVKEALRFGPSQEVLVEGFGLRITRRSVRTLSEFNWLNDEIINFYLHLIMERSKRNRALPKVHAFNTFFYARLAASGHRGLRRWTKTVDIFSFDLIFVPVHLGFHWCLSAIDFRNKSVKYYDSIGTPNDLCLERLLSYIRNESLDKRHINFPVSDWEKSNVVDIPQQMNGSDCGVFVCMFAEHLARNRNFSFTQDNMPYFRKKIAIEVLQKKLLT